MRPNRSSATAENNALLRRHESMRPESERICDDPYAALFLPDHIYSASDQAARICQAVAEWETRFPGVGNAIIARTRFIDDCLQAAVADGIGQLVILGAGYDTRAMRCEALQKSVTVFELDHPSTQAKKRARIDAHFTRDLSHVRYISIDFSQEDLGNRLLAHGYDAGLQTLFIWEGVTYYLTESAVDHTLAFISRHAPSRSSLVFDYFPPAVAAGTTRLAEARALQEGLTRIGEEILFGIAPDQLDIFMQARGFTVMRHLTKADYFDTYFQGDNQDRQVSEMFYFVQARVS